MSDKPAGSGKSSYDLIDVNKTFEIIEVKPHTAFLDLACGAGRYSIRIAENIGKRGTVYAVDLWKEGIDHLNSEIERLGIHTIKTIVADMRKKLPLENNSIDACLLATVLHDLSVDDQHAALKELSRVIKPEGMLTIIEFKKTDKGPGPPVDIRMEEDEVRRIVSRHGFVKVAGADIGEYNYLTKFRKDCI